MSQSDWQFIIGNAARPYFNQNNTGSAQQHSFLSNPITSSGLWCRSFFPAVNENCHFSMIPINNSELTSSSGYQYGHTYSIRCWARANVSANDAAFSIVFKGSSTLDSSIFTGNIQESGYILTMRAQNLSLTCKRTSGLQTNDILEPSNPLYLNGAFQKTNIQSSPLTANLWHRLRMDISPVSGAFDRITIYTGSQNDIWSQQYTVDIPRTKTTAYIPWANNPNGDGGTASGTGYMGFKCSSYNTQYGHFIDQFEVYREIIVT